MSIEWFENLGPWTGKGEFDLRRMQAICEAMGQVQDSVPCFHVAGTNGKGSTSACIAAMLGQLGYAVGANVSPHLVHYSERFLLDGYPIADEQLEEAIELVKGACDSLEEQPTFHEGATLVAFVAFKGLDMAVYEVGLGGRLDASNVLAAPLASIISSIALDHQAILGNTIRKIAFEKAGIFKAGTPAVVGAVCDTARDEILNVAREVGVRVSFFGEDFTVSREAKGYRYKSSEADFSFEAALSGKVQLSNMGCALRALELAGIDIRKASNGLKSVYWPARYESIEFRGKNVLLDCAHNKQGMAALISELDTRELREELFILGMLERADWQEIVAMLANTGHRFLLLTTPGERGLPSRALKEEFEKLGKVDIVDFDSDFAAVIEYASQQESSTLVIAGSIYLLGKLRPLMGIEQRPVWIREKI